MKIALINGSPKAKKSVSEYILKTLKPLLPEEQDFIEYHFRTPELSKHDLEQVAQCNVLVFAYPLYVDGIPSHLIHCLYQMETFFKEKSISNITVYSLVNCGFYEGHQSTIAMEIMKNWCEKAKLTWGQGLGIGGGGMLSSVEEVSDGKGPLKNFSRALKTIAISVSTGTVADNLFISPNFPRFAYKFAAEMGWRRQCKANGLKPKDLFIKR